MVRDTYWATNAEEIQMFHSLKAEQRRSESTKEKREKATHIPPEQWNMIKKCHNAETGHWGINRTIEILKETIEKDPNMDQKP